MTVKRYEQSIDLGACEDDIQCVMLEHERGEWCRHIDAANAIGIVYEQLAAAIAERDAAQRELLEHTNHFADVRRIEEWLATTKPAHLAFTDGPERQVASHLEGLRQERDAAQAEGERLKKQLDQNDIAWARAAVPQIAKSEDQAAELTRLKAELAFQNEAIRNMGNQFDQQAKHNAATIAAMARRCEKFDEAVGLLRRWQSYDRCINDGLEPSSYDLETTAFLATLDAEEKKLAGERDQERT